MKKLALLGVLVLMIATSCSSLKIVDQNSAINAGAAAVQALTISDAQVKQLCSQYMVETDGQNTILPASNEYTQRLDRIMAKFHNISDLNLNYKVYQSGTVNAFASGDGSVRVYTGLMDAMNDDEVFAVIGHELGHLINKRCLRCLPSFLSHCGRPLRYRCLQRNCWNHFAGLPRRPRPAIGTKRLLTQAGD